VVIPIAGADRDGIEAIFRNAKKGEQLDTLVVEAWVTLT
jgi:hypothetical protein